MTKDITRSVTQLFWLKYDKLKLTIIYEFKDNFLPEIRFHIPLKLMFLDMQIFNEQY